jgi:hypothetical protein
MNFFFCVLEVTEERSRIRIHLSKCASADPDPHHYVTDPQHCCWINQGLSHSYLRRRHPPGRAGRSPGRAGRTASGRRPHQSTSSCIGRNAVGQNEPRRRTTYFLICTAAFDSETALFRRSLLASSYIVYKNYF